MVRLSFSPDVTVAAIVERDDRFLMVDEMVSGALVLNQPAGHLEADESLFAAVVRETLEETAWHFVPQALSGIYLWRNPANHRTFLRFAFVGRCDIHHPGRPLDEGIRRAVWMTRDEILAESNRLRSPMVMQCIDDFYAGKRFPLSALNDMGNLSAFVGQNFEVTAI